MKEFGTITEAEREKQKRLERNVKNSSPLTVTVHICIDFPFFTTSEYL
jgi:hypothetical protein